MSVGEIVAILESQNELLQDMTWMEGAPHTTTIRTGLPEATWRKLYGGLQPDKTYTLSSGLKEFMECPYCSVKTTRTHGNCRQCGGPL